MAFGVQHIFRRRHAAWWTLAVGLALTAVLGWELHREAVKLDRQRLAMRVAEITSQLDSRLEKSEMLLHNLRDYLMLSGENREKVFQYWCHENGLTINCPWILGIAVATNRNEVNLQATLPSPPASLTEADWLILNELMNRQTIECHMALGSNLTDGKQFLPDYDLCCAYSDRDIKKPHTNKAWLAGAILGSRLGMSDRQTVMLDTNRNPIVGTTFYVPIYRSELAEYLAVPAPLEHYHRCARWMHLSAIIVAPVDFGVLAQSIWDGKPADVGIEIFSATNQTAETWMNISEGVPRAADQTFTAYLTHRERWPMYGARFSIFFYTTPLFEAQSPRRLAKVAMAAGAGLTLLASALVGVLLRARNRQERLIDQIREARDALAAAQQERERFSRDLHDGTIQSLYALQLGLGRTIEKLEGEPARARRELSGVRSELDAVIAEIRQFISTEAGAGKPVAFSAVLRALVERARGSTTAQVDLHCDAEASNRLTGDQAVHLANIAREALSNSLRHAKPRRVEVALRSEPDHVTLEIVDDGAGFDPQTHDRAGVGLTSMMARTKEMNGTWDIRSAPGKGSRVTIRVPLRPPEPLGAEGPDDSPADA